MLRNSLCSEKGSERIIVFLLPFTSLLTVVDSSKSGFSRVENTLRQPVHCLLRQTEGFLYVLELVTLVESPQFMHIICQHVDIPVDKKPVDNSQKTVDNHNKTYI